MHLRVAWGFAAALLVVTPLVVDPEAKEAFRLVKGLAAGWLALASLVAASWSLRTPELLRVASLWRLPPIRAVLPLAGIVSAGALFTEHPHHFRESFADFAIGCSALVGWAATLGDASLRRLLDVSAATAALVAILALDQWAGWPGMLAWLRVEAPTARLELTSTVGNPGDLAALLVLPLLVLLSRTGDRGASGADSPGGRPGGRAVLIAGIALFAATIAGTQTIAALAAASAGGVVWWSVRAAPTLTRRTRLLVPVTALTALAIVMVAVPPLRARVVEKSAALLRGDVNAVLTGRLDGWRAAVAMVRDSPLRGVGQGGFRAEYAATRLALMDRGVPFFAEQHQVIFATPHNDGLSIAAEQGVPGLITLAWGLFVIAASARRIASREARALAWAGLAALLVLAALSFPFHSPAVAWPWLVHLAWILRAGAGR